MVTSINGAKSAQQFTRNVIDGAHLEAQGDLQRGVKRGRSRLQEDHTRRAARHISGAAQDQLQQAGRFGREVIARVMRSSNSRCRSWWVASRVSTCFVIDGLLFTTARARGKALLYPPPTVGGQRNRQQFRTLVVV